MPIKASTSREVDGLIRDLRAERTLTRDAAIARLTVIGARAVQKLLDVAFDRRAGTAARVAALRALEGIGDPRALTPALGLLTSDAHEIQTAAIGVARTFLRSSAHDVQVLDRLTALALNATATADVRIAALRAIGELNSSTTAPLVERLKQDGDVLVAAAARGGQDGAVTPEQRIARAAGGDPGDDPVALRAAIVRAGGNTSVTTLHSIVETLVAKEKDAADAAPWQAARGAAHLALAQRGSRLALYDLRESLALPNRALPLDFWKALTLIGDVTCLEPIAAAYSTAAAENDVWRRGLRHAFGAIVARHGYTRRHAVIKRVERRWPAILD